MRVRLVLGVVVGLVLETAVLVGSVSAQCADPRGNSYCENNGQVTFTTPGGGTSNPTNNAPAPNAPAPNNAPAQQQSPAVQSNAPVSADASITLDPPSAAAGESVSITGRGLGGGRSAWVNLSHMTSAQGLNLGAQQLATINTAPDGSLTTTVVIPSVPSWTAGKADICVINATAQPVCTPFTLTSAEEANTNTATTPDAIVGHYQCSSATLIGFGGGWCTGGEPVLALNGDGTYSYGNEQGSWSFDGTIVTFDGSLGSAAVLNRRLTIDTQIDMPDGSGVQAVRYFYIRMNY